MLRIQNLHAGVAGKQILKGVNLQVRPGEIHAIMGPNGSGKSTLSHVLAGKAGYTIDRGEVTYRGQNLLDMDIELRAREGVFLAFQYPVEIAGVSNMYLLKTALNAIRKHQGLDEIDAIDFLNLVKERVKLLQIDEKFLYRAVNEGFSGGEKKRNEILQAAVLEPKLCILDETDSGLDIDALKIVANGIEMLRSADRSFLLITHYQRMLDYIKPDAVHVLYNGSIIKSGDASLAKELEARGYEWLAKEAS